MVSSSVKLETELYQFLGSEECQFFVVVYFSILSVSTTEHLPPVVGVCFCFVFVCVVFCCCCFEPFVVYSHMNKFQRVSVVLLFLLSSMTII